MTGLLFPGTGWGPVPRKGAIEAELSLLDVISFPVVCLGVEGIQCEMERSSIDNVWDGLSAFYKNQRQLWSRPCSPLFNPQTEGRFSKPLCPTRPLNRPVSTAPSIRIDSSTALTWTTIGCDCTASIQRCRAADKPLGWLQYLPDLD